MTTEINKTYMLEQLTTDSVNIIIKSSVEIDGKSYEIERSRISYGNSPIGRREISKLLPEQYVTAILAIWGDTTTISDPAPEPETESEPEVISE